MFISSCILVLLISAHPLTPSHTLLTPLTFSQADTAVTELREAALEIANIHVPPLSRQSGEQLVRLEELEGLTSVQEREITCLTGQVRNGGV